MELYGMENATVPGARPANNPLLSPLLPPPQPQFRIKASSRGVHEQEGPNPHLHEPENSHTIGALSQIQATSVLA